MAIIVSTFTLAFEMPLEDPNSDNRKRLAVLNKVMTVIFAIEAILKIIAVGFFFNGS